MLPRLEAEREAKLRESGLTPQDAADLRDIESDVRRASVFGITEDEARGARERIDDMRERLQAVGYGEAALEVPWWPSVRSWEHREGREVVTAPMLYTKRERAEEEARRLEAYLELVEGFGQASADEALGNTPPYRALWVERETLLDKLRHSDFLCVMVDERMKLRADFLDELVRMESEDA
jgi:hypothetical protein